MLGTYVIPCLHRQKFRRRPHFGEDTKLESVYEQRLYGWIPGPGALRMETLLLSYTVVNRVQSLDMPRHHHVLC